MGLRITLSEDDIVMMSGGIVVKVRRLYELSGKKILELEIAAPDDIKIHRFHTHESDSKLKYLLDKFDDEDELDEIKQSLEYLIRVN